MEHTSRIVAKKKLADGQIAVLIQCCDDATHQSWHTFSVTKDTQTTDLTAWLAERQQHVQDGHAAALAVDAHLDSLINL